MFKFLICLNIIKYIVKNSHNSNSYTSQWYFYEEFSGMILKHQYFSEKKPFKHVQTWQNYTPNKLLQINLILSIAKYQYYTIIITKHTIWWGISSLKNEKININ